MTIHNYRITTLAALVVAAAVTVSAQSLTGALTSGFNPAPAPQQPAPQRGGEMQTVATTASATPEADSTAAAVAMPMLGDYAGVDEYLSATAAAPYDTLVSLRPLPRLFFLPAVFRGYEFADTTTRFRPDFSGVAAMRWLEEEQAMAQRTSDLLRPLFYRHPDLIPYNINLLPEAPKRYQAVVNPEEHTIEIHELASGTDVAPTIEAAPVKKSHWIRTFNASLQFSQAYVSPNWYQGGNNALNALANIYYNVKLNQAYHPNLLFESTVQYKLGINNAPDDSIHAYNISDDLLQANLTFGVKAARRWYYSVNVQFKTQLLNSYVSNSHELRSAFLSPGELNVGLGMTYNYTNPKKTVQFDASIAPLSYNLKFVTNHSIDPGLYDIDEGRRASNRFGSSAELKLMWKIVYNITFTSRLFAFTNYSEAYVDWENTVAFAINRFLTTQIYAHARYDTATPRCADPSWHKLQVKEILSIGFAYKFSDL